MQALTQDNEVMKACPTLGKAQASVCCPHSRWHRSTEPAIRAVFESHENDRTLPRAPVAS